ncbi:hypothetical protein INR49_006871 [Caranx melampygus]|nr:hypothetical protein INR49_006871 [Caranx melampygus]
MGARQLVVFGLVLVCVGLSDARVLGRREPAYRRLEAQKPMEEAPPGAEPERGHSRPPAEPAGGLQVKIYRSSSR